MATIKYDLPLIPLRDVVVFPGVVSTLFVGRNKSINALNAAMASEKKIILSAQKDGSLDAPLFDDLYKVATIANILQLIKLPDGTVKVLVEGSHRAQMQSLESDDKFSKVRVSLIAESKIDPKDGENLSRFIKAKFHDFIKITKKIAPEVLASIDALDDLSRIIDSIAGHLPMEIKQKQEILETADFQLRAEILIAYIESQLDVMDVDKRIRNRVKGQMEKVSARVLLK
jgi:ATP-dependent Lon protease